MVIDYERQSSYGIMELQDGIWLNEEDYIFDAESLDNVMFDCVSCLYGEDGRFSRSKNLKETETKLTDLTKYAFNLREQLYERYI